MKPSAAHRVTAAVEVAASPQRVWEVVSDITVMPQLSTELLSVEWAEGWTGPRLGAQFLGRNRNPVIGEWTTRSQIIAYEPPRLFGWSVGDPEKPAANWVFELQPSADRTRLRYTAEIGPGPSGVTMLIERSPERAEQIIDGRLAQFRKAVVATLAGVRDRAETGR
ncbi:MAG: SRPBCC family protein [Mycobacterium sp.]|nr:SRPBCC family protein [Mycobacterium sp.]